MEIEKGEERKETHLGKLVPVLVDQVGELVEGLLTDLDIGALPRLLTRMAGRSVEVARRKEEYERAG